MKYGIGLGVLLFLLAACSGGGPDLSLAGTVVVPAGITVAGTEVAACYVVAGVQENPDCEGPNDRSLTLTDSGTSAAFSFTGLKAGSYLLVAGRDEDGNDDPSDPGDLIGCYPDIAGCAEVTPTRDGLTITVNFVPGTVPGRDADYNIELKYGANVTEAQKALFGPAATRWGRLITGDLDDYYFQKPDNFCGLNEPADSGRVDDLTIYVDVVPIDGPNNTLARAGPCIQRANGLAAYGVMNIDSEDVGDPQLSEIIVHEMGHVLGIGVQWEARGLLNLNGADCAASTSITYKGQAGTAAYATLGGQGEVPAENDGGPGTKCVHWEEGIFDTEMMTGAVDYGSALPLSVLTVGSLEDLGYSVDYTAADPYALPTCRPGCNAVAAERRWADHEVLLFPRFEIGEDGVLRRLDTH